MSLNLNQATASISDLWPDPSPLPKALAPVAPFELEMLPTPFRPWVGDISERMQAPPDFVAVAAMVAAGSLIGRKVGIRPQQQNDWTEVANLWGCIVGRPSVLKSPSMRHALRPLRELEDRAREEHQAAIEGFKAGAVGRELQSSAIKEAMKERLKANPHADVSDLAAAPEDEPKATRYIVNDAGYQALAEVLRLNAPNGVLTFRDELMSLIRSLDDEGRVEDRGFFLSGWNGVDSYTSDRIGRGFNLYIPAVTISLLGSTQPGRITDFVKRSVAGGGGDDGLFQRLSLIVWPDLDPDWKEVDRAPCPVARAEATTAFQRLARLTPDEAAAHLDEYNPERSFLRFDPEAQAEFSKWWGALERRLRSGEMHESLESHLGKYRGLVPKLALIHHLVEGRTGSIRLDSLLSACAWAEYLETHAVRAYGSAIDDSLEGASIILERIKRGKIDSPFTLRELHEKGWKGLSDREAVSRACERLEEHGFIRVREVETGGRPSIVAHINPKLAPRYRNDGSKVSA